MSILAIDSTQPAGLTSVNPSVVYILTSDTYAVVTATGYLTKQAQQGFTFNNQQMALVYTTDEGPVWLKIVISYSGATVLNTVVSLVELSSPGSVALPTITNHLIVSTDTSGDLANLSGTAINGGSLQAGLSGTAGTLISYPSASSKGSLVVAAVANSGDTVTTLSNVAMGQASVVSIPDPANAVGRLLIGATATPFVSGNFPVASGTAGLMVDSGVSASNLQNKTNIKAAVTGNIGGSGAGPISVTVAGITTSSVVVASLVSSSNPVQVQTVAAASGHFSVTFSGDPGASAILNYVVFIAAQ